MTRTITIISAALLVSLALTCSSAKDVTVQQHQQPLSLTSKLMPQTKARSSRSLSDVFEKMKSKLFGGRKQQQALQATASTGSQVQSSVSASQNAAHRQPTWTDLNSFNQQYNPYSALTGSYQWPTAAANQAFMGQSYGSLAGYSPAGYPAQSSSGNVLQSLENSQQASNIIGQQVLAPAANSNAAPSGQSSGGLLSSASHLIAQYLSPSSSSSSTGSSSGASQTSSQGQSIMNGQQQQSMPTPQQQQQQSQYNDFASMLDSMVAQTSASVQRQPNMNQYMGSASMSGSPSQGQLGGGQQQGSGFQTGPQSNSLSAIGASNSLMGDNDMSASSSVQSYMPVATPQQASQKSSMVSLAEQLSPGSQFNKLVSFPFSLSSNDDPSKEGRYKLHIPFLNQHVKRSDQPQQVASTGSGSLAAQQRAQQQQIQQYLNSYYNQQQLYANSPLANPAVQQQQSQQQLAAQSSQVVPSIVSPQSSSSSVASQSSSAAAAPSSSSSVVSSSASASSSPSALALSAQSSQSSSSSSLLSQPAASSSVSAIQSNPRPNWSVADSQSSSSSSKLIPIQSAAPSSSIEVVSQS